MGEARELGAGGYERLWTERWGDMQRYGPVSRHQRRILDRLLEGLEVGSALDVGCGEGSLLRQLAARYPAARLAGLDVSEAAVAQARLAVPTATLSAGTAAALREDGAHDLVTCFDVLEHVEDDEGLLRDLARLSRAHVLVMSIQGRMRPSEREIGHVRNYAAGELVAKVRRAGLEPLRVVEWGFPFYSPLFRTAVELTGSEPLAAGRYGPGKRALCHAIYGLFLLNSWRRGDKIFVLARRRA